MGKKYCVYVHTNKVNGKRYIGITSQKPETRWKNGYAGNQYFSRAIEKYGWKGFNHEVIMVGLTKEQACLWEKTLIALYETQNRDKGYNIQSGGEGCVEQNNIPVNQYSLSGKYIKTWASMKEADASFGTFHNGGSQIGMACIGKNCKTAHGYMWRYFNDDISDIKPHTNSRYKSIAQYTTNGTLVRVWDSIKEASETLGIDNGTITNVCKGKHYRTAGGYVWRYCANDPPKDIECTKSYKRQIVQYDATGDIVRTFESVSDARRHIGTKSNAHIIACCKGIRKTAHGYKWRYSDEL